MPKKSPKGWPLKKCFRCGEDIQLVKTSSGWTSYDLETFQPHKCEIEDEEHGEKAKVVYSWFESNRRRH